MFYELQLHAQEKIREYEKQAELERLLKEAGALPPLRTQLARFLQHLAVKLAPDLSHPEPAKSYQPPRRTSVRGAR